MTADARDELHARATVPVPGNRLPEAGAGFVWDGIAGPSGRSPVLRPLAPGVSAVYTTRIGGSSPPPADSLNLSLLREPDVPGRDERVAANRRAIGSSVGSRAGWSTVRQVHGAEVVGAPGCGREGGVPEADALWTDEPGRPLAVFSADCLLLLLLGPGGLAVAHAGWRGLVAGVVERAVEAVGARSAFAGPAIGPCCFEVDDDVLGPFGERFGDRVLGDRRVDLWKAAETAAASSGVEVVRTARICTSCRPDLFFSHRRDAGRTGRQGLVAALEGRPRTNDDDQR